jgi:ribonuclease BN (tRNA processing enzyme)
VELTVLGSAGTWPPAGGATCGYLLSHEGTHIWLDAGTGTFAELQKHVGIDEIAAIVITHGHPDHFVAVIPAFYARHYGGLAPGGLPFYSPDGFVKLMSLLVSEGGRDVIAKAYAFTTLRHGDAFEVGPFAITAYEMTHVGVEALGYRIEAGGVVLAYTGDSGPCEEVIEMARDADVFLAEASYQDASTLMPFHLSARQAAEHATKAGAKRLLLTHILPTLDERVSLAEAREAFDGPVEVAVQGLETVIGS